MDIPVSGEKNPQTSLELLYHVSREFAASSDLGAVLQRVVELSMRAVKAANGSMIVLDDKKRPVEAVLMVGEQRITHSLDRMKMTLDKGLAGWVVCHSEPVLIEDTNRDERWLPVTESTEKSFGSKSALCAPLLVRGQLVGVMTLVHPTPGFFTPDHLALFQAIADQAGIAVLNARLYADSQRQARVFAALAESAASINSSLEINAVLDVILKQISQVLNVEAVSLALLDPANHELVFQAASGWTHFSPGLARLFPGQGFAGWIFQEGQAAIIPDARNSPHFDPEIETRTGWRVNAVACAPISSQNQIIGVLEAINPKMGEFHPDVLLVLTGIGSLAGTAIHNAQLYERLQAAHQRLDTLRDDLISMIYHDLQSPLSNVISSLDISQSILQEKPDPDLESLIEIASRSTQRIQRMINSLLDINRLEAGRPLAERKSISPLKLAEQAAGFVLPVAQNYRQNILLSIPVDLPQVFVDGDMILRVLTNLLENAVKYSNSVGDIIIGGRQDGEWVTLWVEDQGPGIPREDRERIFDKYTRLDDQGKKGFGLGLAFCRLAVQAHGGRIWVENLAGAGSRFQFTLPQSA